MGRNGRKRAARKAAGTEQESQALEAQDSADRDFYRGYFSVPPPTESPDPTEGIHTDVPAKRQQTQRQNTMNNSRWDRGHKLVSGGLPSLGKRLKLGRPNAARDCCHWLVSRRRCHRFADAETATPR